MSSFNTVQKTLMEIEISISVVISLVIIGSLIMYRKLCKKKYILYSIIWLMSSISTVILLFAMPYIDYLRKGINIFIILIAVSIFQSLNIISSILLIYAKTALENRCLAPNAISPLIVMVSCAITICLNISFTFVTLSAWGHI